jgi:hypothetical protein
LQANYSGVHSGAPLFAGSAGTLARHERESAKTAETLKLKAEVKRKAGSVPEARFGGQVCPRSRLEVASM